MHENVEVTIRDPFCRHGEEVVRSRYGPGVRKRWAEWPQTGVSIEDFRDKEVIVAKVDGVVAGRAILDAVYYPFAELENLEVMPAFRGVGLGGRIVAEAVRRAGSMGFLALHIQTELDNVAAQRLYARHGFLPATQGKMLKLVRFLNYPALTQFLWEHPLALLGSRPVESAGRPIWEFSWADPAGGQELAIRMLGGSCQADSDGYGPGVCSFSQACDDVRLTADFSGPPAVSRGQTFDVELKISNRGPKEARGACRLLLNPGFRPPNGTPGSATFCLAPGTAEVLTLPVVAQDAFNSEVLRVCAYPSVSTVVEVFIDEMEFWLSCQHKVT
jgi:GNAT superfamily N-acetyltransferase